MADRPDEDLDSWLSQRIEPLPPPPGTFELIKRRARRRKLAKLAISAGAAAVIVAAAVTVPQVVNLPVLPGPTQSPAAGRSSSSATASAPSASAAATSATPVASASAPLAAVPPNFRPTSVTFIGQATGWVIGQAGTPGHCATPYCTSLARTDDAGKSWIGVPAPLTGAPDGGTGVGQVRFLNRVDGWAFGPELFATSDGGHSWTRVGPHGLRVIALETVGSRAFGVFASCTGTGAGYAAGCTRFTLYSSPAGTADWARVGPATTGLNPPAGSYGSVSLALTGSRGYLLGPDGTLYAGPVDGSAAWSQVGLVPCAASLQPGSQPAGALLATVNATSLVLGCTVTTTPGQFQKKQMYSSANGGSSWQQVIGGPGPGITSSLAASPGDAVVLGTNQGIDLLPAGGAGWQQATVTQAPAGGFSYVGMTTADQGVAVPADPTTGRIWFTYDGGRSWQPSRVA